MTQEEKQLLLKDLCARLPYGVVMNVTEPGEDRVNFNCFLGPDIIKEIISEIGHFKYKPYLRPRSEIAKLISAKEFTQLSGIDLIDWYNANHIDYRGLIPIGLAIEAPKGMYK